jgi:hypothetical protein
MYSSALLVADGEVEALKHSKLGLVQGFQPTN